MLDVLGMIPGIGAMADLANGFWYLSEGDYFSAASSFVSAIPGIGDIAGGIAKGITGCTKISKAIKFATRFASNIGNFALGAYSTTTQIYGLWDKYVIKGEPWGDESLGEFLGAAFTGVTTVLSGKGVVDDIANYKNTKHDILTSQCFVEGTLVVTADGNKPIEEIQAGDLVYSTNPETGESEYKEVLRTFRKETDVLIHIFVNSEEIQTTPVHPFWVENQWVAAKDLETGDVLTLADGTTATVTKTYGEQLEHSVIVYNFEVSEFHTYYVTNTGVLVHNDKKCSSFRDLMDPDEAARYDAYWDSVKNGDVQSVSSIQETIQPSTINGVPTHPKVVRRFMSESEYKVFMKNGFTYNALDSRGGISSTSVKVKPYNPDGIKLSTGALGADRYVDIDVSDKIVFYKGKTKGGLVDYKIQSDVSITDIVGKGRVRK